MKILLVIDMQNDFIDGALGTPEAVAIIPKVVQKIKEFKGAIIFTRDTHQKNYLNTAEGTHLPVEHCLQGTPGWDISEQFSDLVTATVIDKPAFGSKKLPNIINGMLKGKGGSEEYLELTLIGLCTDICVISNAIILKAFFPETKITVDADCCAGVTPQGHRNALEAMKMCHILIENEVV